MSKPNSSAPLCSSYTMEENAGIFIVIFAWFGINFVCGLASWVMVGLGICIGLLVLGTTFIWAAVKDRKETKWFWVGYLSFYYVGLIAGSILHFILPP